MTGEGGGKRGVEVAFFAKFGMWMQVGWPIDGRGTVGMLQGFSSAFLRLFFVCSSSGLWENRAWEMMTGMWKSLQRFVLQGLF